MNWANIDDFNSEEDKDTSLTQNDLSSEKMQTEEGDKKTIQLLKYANPADNQSRQALIALVNRFGDLLIQNQMQKTISSLFAANCECFFYNFLDQNPVAYVIGNQNFLKLYKGARIVERKVRETHVDSDKNVVFQICDCKILQSDGGSVMTQATFEVFTVNNDKIMRYQAGFASYIPAHGSTNPFEPTRKDVMLAKIKEINYALADQPDLEKVASLMHEKTKYKMLDWDRVKVHTFHKDDLLEGFRNLQEHYTLKCIVPYEVYNDREFIIGTYVYHLESKDSGKEYIWLSTCLYSFDKDLNLVNMNQQGELYPKDSIAIPFEVYDREKIHDKVHELLEQIPVDVDLFYTHKVDFNCTISRFGPTGSPFIGTYQGMKELASHMAKVQTCLTLDWSQAVDIYVDSHDPGYDVAIAMTCSQGVINSAKSMYKERHMNYMTITKYCFENGKLAKMYQFYFDAIDLY